MKFRVALEQPSWHSAFAQPSKMRLYKTIEQTSFFIYLSFSASTFP
jgi:hypothetical protein